MDMTIMLLNLIFDPTDTLLPLQTGLSFVGTEMVCAVFERTSGFEVSSESTASAYLALDWVPSFCYPLGVMCPVCH